ncbi:hypothetical protein ASPWEDRAFT_186169 [Aspergillus wentii DTO 134E9]|uniref:Uncharacterized protein n=1 Tax=Aspergillus wentii DTO 134E9 TaxID=1073089 RepID=A0A1L9RAJ7_ASPWE|nr:uncharacterized protein ASPWEDRAFT_186169 [Aspergillus wentii DTO 134E9]KAI9934513.1 hypothetical protein MW887_000127 [Aspergillus wentii]OJJ31929.1 hypothetical protein ASPWEDRAFT_186169 [Aspergillus wentii DTO 134E9]
MDDNTHPTDKPTLPVDLSTLPPEEFNHVCQLATQMQEKTSAEDIQLIGSMLSKITPEKAQYLATQNMDPMTYFFRTQALYHLKRERRTQEMAHSESGASASVQDK